MAVIESSNEKNENFSRDTSIKVDNDSEAIMSTMRQKHQSQS